MIACDFDKGSEIILPAHSFASSAFAILHAGLVPKFVDVGSDHNILVDKIQDKITSKTRAIMCVHMNGTPCQMDEICSIAKQNDLTVLEDAAQSFGARFQDSFCGSFGRFAAFSMHPLKNLNVAGDGGFLTTNSESLAKDVAALRNIGQEKKGVHSLLGYNSRLDNIQAAIANIKLDHFDFVVNQRSKIAKVYFDELQDLNLEFACKTTFTDTAIASSYSNFVVVADNRDKLRSDLADAGVETLIAWDPPIYQSKFINGGVSRGYPNTKKLASQSLNLPINQFMSHAEVEEVIFQVKKSIKKIE